MGCVILCLEQFNRSGIFNTCFIKLPQKFPSRYPRNCVAVDVDWKTLPTVFEGTSMIKRCIVLCLEQFNRSGIFNTCSCMLPQKFPSRYPRNCVAVDVDWKTLPTVLEGISLIERCIVLCLEQFNRSGIFNTCFITLPQKFPSRYPRNCCGGR